MDSIQQRTSDLCRYRTCGYRRCWHRTLFEVLVSKMFDTRSCHSGDPYGYRCCRLVLPGTAYWRVQYGNIEQSGGISGDSKWGLLSASPDTNAACDNASATENHTVYRPMDFRPFKRTSEKALIEKRSAYFSVHFYKILAGKTGA